MRVTDGGILTDVRGDVRRLGDENTAAEGALVHERFRVAAGRGGSISCAGGVYAP
jgi:hypothetical protein